MISVFLLIMRSQLIERRSSVTDELDTEHLKGEAAHLGQLWFSRITGYLTILLLVVWILER